MIVLSRRAALRASVGTSAAAALAFAGKASAQGLGPENALTVMQEDGRFTNWLAMISAAGLDRYATGRNPYSMFAPTNAAMSKYPYIVRDLLYGTGGSRAGQGGAGAMPETGRITRAVRSHAFPGVHPPSEFVGKKTSVKSFAGSDIDIDGSGGGDVLIVVMHIGTTLDSAKADTNVLTSPGVVIYPIDSFNLEIVHGLIGPPDETRKVQARRA